MTVFGYCLKTGCSCQRYKQSNDDEICAECGCENVKHAIFNTCLLCNCDDYKMVIFPDECVQCGHDITDHSQILDLFVLLNRLVEKNKSNNMILKYLEEIGIHFSERTLRRRLVQLGIKRHEEIPQHMIYEAVNQEIMKSGYLAGIRRVYDNCRQRHHLKVKRLEVQNAMSVIDPEGRKLRKCRILIRRVFFSKGPDWIWAMDGNDKLQYFHIYIHGCIDTFSRKLLWLEVYKTNKDPRVIVKYFYDTVRRLGVCPRRTRSDPGTENVDVIECQMFLRSNHNDDLAYEKSHILGPSPLNQKIESWWSIFQRRVSIKWQEELMVLHRDGHYDRNNLIDKYCILYVYLPLIKTASNEFVSWWNNHRIRRQRQVRLPTGATPNDMYSFPDSFGGERCAIHVPHSDLEEIAREKGTSYDLPHYLPENFQQFADQYCYEHGIIDLNNAQTYYKELRHHCQISNIDS